MSLHLEERPLRTLTSKIGSGATPKGGERSYKDTGIPLIRSQNVYDLVFEESGLAFIDDLQASQLDGVRVEEGDVLINITGASVARCCFAPPEMAGARVNQHVAIIRPKRGELDGRFLAYVLISPRYKARLLKLAGAGATREALTKGGLERFEIEVPSFTDQRRIASILGAYDDLIDVNGRRIELLETMAHALFDEWFVRLRFPGHESVAIIETANGPLPHGWHYGVAGNLIDFDPATRMSKQGAKPFIPMGLLDTANSLIGQFETRDGNSGAKFQNDDTLFARITPCLENGKTGIVRDLPGDGRGFGSTEFIVMRAKRAGPAFAYCLARHSEFRRHAERGMAGASGRQRTRAEVVAGFRLPLPPVDANLFEAFERIAWPLLKLVGTLGRINSELAASRDLLLPRLISGQLDLSRAKQVMASTPADSELVAAE